MCGLGSGRSSFRMKTELDLFFFSLLFIYFKINFGYFPGGPVVKTSPSNSGGAGSIPGRGAKIPHALWPKNQNIKQKQNCNEFNKD